MKVYAGIDLHSSNGYIGLMDGTGRRLHQVRVRNDLQQVLEALRPYRARIAGIAVESTYNWYWLVDGLKAAGYPLHLASPSGMQKYRGKKHVDDRHDAFWLAELLRLGILPEGYIYPKKDRPVRDLLRKRGHLVRLRTSLMNSLQGMVARNGGAPLPSGKVKAVRTDHVTPALGGDTDQRIMGTVSKECIDFFTRKIQEVEKVVEGKVELKPAYRPLLTIPGVGKILALTIMLESGPMIRFKKVGCYASYCRKVPSRWESNGKWKGTGNAKNGNRYLAWAFSEAAEKARRYDPDCRAYFQRKTAKRHRMIGHAALAHKLARAAYYVMRDRVPFDATKLFV